MPYTWQGMIKISYEEALLRFDNKQEVYLLYSDNTEAKAFNLIEINDHKSDGGEYGYEA